MGLCLFAADVHLTESEPQTVAWFEAFLQGPATEADDLYLLGDIFEVWVGDDALTLPFYQRIVTGLRHLSQAGTRLWLMHGNRDFLMGDQLAAACGGQLISECTVIHPDGVPTLLLHGDALCTADVDYLAFRRQVRTPAWQSAFLARPLAERLAIVAGMRQESEDAKRNRDAYIMDVDPAAVATMLQQYGCTRMIHGHTHRPALHEFNLAGQPALRAVVPAWHEKAGWLRLDAHGCQLTGLPAS